MITKKTYYRVPKFLEKEHCFLADLPCGVWCTDILKTDILKMEDVKKMDFEKIIHDNQCKCITGTLIDDSLKYCLLFTYLDGIHYGDDFESRYEEITWERIIEECDPVEAIACE